MGQYYAFRGIDAWAADSLEHARKAGGTVSPLLLGQCYWRLKRYAEAQVEYEKALQLKEAPDAYLHLCIDALKGAGANADQTQPGGKRPRRGGESGVSTLQPLDQAP